MKKIHWRIVLGIMAFHFMSCADADNKSEEKSSSTGSSNLFVSQDEQSGAISVFREGSKQPLLVQNAKEGFRPYLHPLAAPDGKGVLTEYSPAHHKHAMQLNLW